MALKSPRAARLISAAVILTFIGLTSLPAGCTKVPLVAPSGTVITLIATTNVLPINGAADIIAVLVENGTTPPANGGNATTSTSTGNPVHNGTLVSFTTTLGRVEPAEAKTSNGGQVTVKLIADGRSGVATITAFSGGASKTLTVNVGAAAAARIVLSAIPTSLPPNGGTSTVTANVQDQQGNPIQGVPVTFSTTAGSLSAATVVSDSSGNATATVTTAAAATITASAGGGGTSTLQGTVALTLQSRGTVNLTAPTGTVTEGMSTMLIVTVGTTVAASEVVLDYGDGHVRDLGPVSGTTQQAHVYERSGTYAASVTAKFVDGSTQTHSSDVVVGSYDFNIVCGPNVSFASGGQQTVNLSFTPAGFPAGEVLWNFNGEKTYVGGTTMTHIWQSRGTKTVTATVRPANAPQRTRPCQIEVT